MKSLETEIADVKIIEPEVNWDARGFFLETFQVRKMAAAGIGASS